MQHISLHYQAGPEESCEVLHCLLHVPQAELASGTAERTVTVRKPSKTWGMCSKYWYTCPFSWSMAQSSNLAQEIYMLLACTVHRDRLSCQLPAEGWHRSGLRESHQHGTWHFAHMLVSPPASRLSPARRTVKDEFLNRIFYALSHKRLRIQI